MRSFRHSLFPALLFVATIFSGCGTSYLEMSRMAGYVGAQRGRIYVVSIEGKDADKFRDQLYESLSDDGHFAAERYGVAPPENSDSTTNIPSIILSGIHSADESTRFFTEGSGKDEKKYRERIESHEFQYSIRDAVTGEELEASVIHHEHVGAKEEDTGFLDAVIGNAVTGLFEGIVGVEAAHRKELIRTFVSTLRLHPEKRLLGLPDDKDIPELKEGVEFARREDWAAAIAKFQAGAETHPKSEALHKAYFNLGVAFEYNHDFEKALTSLRLAAELAPQGGYESEIDHCTWFARQYRWQQRYAGTSSDVAR
jgi:tetratricopeptide (TPR) repeat protein